MRLVWTLVMLAAAPAAAADISWTVPSGCPSHAALQETLERRLGTSLQDVSLIADVTIERDADQYVARVDIHVPVEESRVLTSNECGELTDAVTLVLAQAAEQARVAPVPVVPPLVAVQRAPRAELARTASWNGGMRLAGLVGTGATPGLGIAGEVGGWLSWRSWALAVSAARWHERTVMLDGTMSGVDVGLTALAVRLGWRPVARPVRAWAIAQWGSIRGTGVGLDDLRGDSAPWRTVGLGAGWAFAITARLAAVVAAEGEFLLGHARFTLDRGTELYRTPAAALRGTLTLELGWR